MRLSDIIEKNLVMLKDGEFEVFGICSSEINKKILTFLSDEKYIEEAFSNQYISCIICTEEISKKISDRNYGILISKNPRYDFCKLNNTLSLTDTSKQTIIGKNCNISKFANISETNVIIGDNVTIEAFATIKDNTIIGNNSIIGTGVVIGGEGFEFARNNDDILSVKHTGGVKIGENVEIKDNTCIDKAVFSWDNTTIGNNTKIDNLVHIAHASKTGKNVMITAGVVVCGSAIIKDNVFIGPNAVIGHIIVNKNAKITVGAIVTKDVEEGITVSGNFAIEHNKFINFIKSIR